MSTVPGQHLHLPLTLHHQVPELKETEWVGLCALIPVKMLQEDLQAHLMVCTVPITRLSCIYHLPFLPPPLCAYYHFCVPTTHLHVPITTFPVLF